MSTKCTKAKQVPDMSPLTVMSTRWMLDSNSQMQRCKKGSEQVGPRTVGPQTIGCNGQQPPHYFKFQIEGHRSRFILIEFLIPQGSVYCASCFQAFSKSALNLFFCLLAGCSLSVRHLLVHSEANRSLHTGQLRNTVKRNTVKKQFSKSRNTVENTAHRQSATYWSILRPTKVCMQDSSEMQLKEIQLKIQPDTKLSILRRTEVCVQYGATQKTQVSYHSGHLH